MKPSKELQNTINARVTGTEPDSLQKAIDEKFAEILDRQHAELKEMREAMESYRETFLAHVNPPGTSENLTLAKASGSFNPAWGLPFSGPTIPKSETNAEYAGPPRDSEGNILRRNPANEERGQLFTELVAACSRAGVPRPENGHVAGSGDNLKQELKPCPFCGDSNPIVRDGENGYEAECTRCQASVFAETHSRAWAAWNTRRSRLFTPDEYKGVEGACVDILNDKLGTSGATIGECAEQGAGIIDIYQNALKAASAVPVNLPPKLKWVSAPLTYPESGIYLSREKEGGLGVVFQSKGESVFQCVAEICGPLEIE